MSSLTLYLVALCVGLGIGIIVLAGGTTAGTTILAQIANKYLDVSTAYALLFLI